MQRCLGFGLAVLMSWIFASGASAALVAYYPFNGSANEATGNNINLNLVGDAGYAASVNAGLGSALSLDGTGDGAIGPGFVKITTNNMTAVAWVNAASLDGDWNSVVKNWGTSVGGQFHFGLGSVAANTLQSIAAGASNATAATAIPTNEWIHVAFVLDAAALKNTVYINGAVVASAAFSGTLGLGTATGLGVGHKPNNDGTALDAGGGPGPWNGRIDEVGLFNEALTTAQIVQIYENGLAGTPLSTVPEPASLIGLLLLAGVAGMTTRRRHD
jgi:hypothetical protein